MTSTRAAVGFRVKSGWATVVLLGGPASAPTLIESGTVELSDPKVPDARQPYHPGLDLPGRPGRNAVTRLVRGVERFARSSLGRLFRRFRADGHRVRGVGIVAGSLGDPKAIGNDHIRAHAYEGRLFRVVIERAARAARLPPLITAEKRLFGDAARVLRRSETQLKRQLLALGEGATGSWRVEERAAALAAWMALASRGRR